MTLFRNKYRIESTRLKHWNYANAGAYFITICTKNRLHYFGEIVETRCMASNNNHNETPGITSNNNHNETSGMTSDHNHNETPCMASLQLSEIGKIVENEWLKTPEIRPDMNLQLGAFVVMPNHFHGIIIIGDNEYNSGNQPHATVETRCIASPPNNAPPNMALGNETSGMTLGSETPDMALGNETPDMASLRGPQRKNLASIIRGFKSAVTIEARIVNPAFAWQERFHDHVIRNYEEYLRIENYILNNPKNWKADKFHQS